MTLYDFIKLTECDYDTYDTVYDTSVTVSCIAEEDEADDYDRFCNAIIKKVNVVKNSGDSLVADWNKLICDNMEKFKEFTAEHWKHQYEDDEDEFIYQWINEIHMYIAGYVTEDFYTTLIKFVDSLEF